MSATASPTAVDPAAGIESVFREHHQRVFRAAYRITGNATDAEDVLQSVFLRLLGRRPDAAPVINLACYLHRAAVNAALDLVRIRQHSLDLPADYAGPAPRRDPRESRLLLRQAIARLSPKAAEIFVLRYFEGYDNPEIAQMLGLSVSDVAVTLHRSRARLKEEICHEH